MSLRSIVQNAAACFVALLLGSVLSPVSAADPEETVVTVEVPSSEIPGLPDLGAASTTPESEPSLAALPSVASAVPVEASAPVAASVTEAPKVSRFGLEAKVSAASSLHEWDDADHSSEALLFVIPSYKLTETLTAKLRLGVSKQLENLREESVLDSKVSVGHKPIELNPYLTLIPSVAATLPTSKQSYKGDLLRVGIHLQPVLSVKFDQLGLPLLHVDNAIAVSRYFHGAEVSNSGKSNSEYSLSETLAVGYEVLPSKLTVSAAFMRGLGFTYQGHPKNNFAVSQELAWSVTPKLELSIGHANEGAAYKENGTDSNVSLLSPTGSSVYMAVAWAL